MSLPFCLPQLNRVSDSTGRVDQTVTRFDRIDILVNSVGAGEVMADLIVDSEVAFGVKKMIEHLSPD